MTMLDPRYKSRFIESPQDVATHIKLEMDTVGHQECKITCKKRRQVNFNSFKKYKYCLICYYI